MVGEMIFCAYNAITPKKSDYQMDKMNPAPPLTEIGEDNPEILEVKTIVTTQIFQVESVKLKFSNGAIREFERLKMWEPGIVMIVPMLDAHTFLLAREYATGVNDYIVSFPKGRVEIGEDLLVAANRELQEEIGYAAKKLSYLCAMTNAPNYSPTQTHLILAQDLVPSRLPADEPEPLGIIPWKMNEIEKLLARKDFHEARAIAALFLAKEQMMKQL